MEEEKETLIRGTSEAGSQEKKEEVVEKWDHDKYREIVAAEQEQKRNQAHPVAFKSEEEPSQKSNEVEEKDKGAKKYGNYFNKQYEDATRQPTQSKKRNWD